MLKYAANHLLFLRDLSVPFENNGSERLLRKAKGKLKQSGGVLLHGERRAAVLRLPHHRGDGQDARIQPYRAVHATFAGEGGLFA